MNRRTETCCVNARLKGAPYLGCNYEPKSDRPCSVHLAIATLEPAKVKNFVDYHASTGRACHYDVRTGMLRAEEL